MFHKIYNNIVIRRDLKVIIIRISNKGKTIRIIRRCIQCYLSVGAVYSRGYCAAAAVAAAVAAAEVQGSAKTGHLAVG